jgi:hypothetical protein
MARPRVFVSSTFYDLKYVRADLEQFIKSLGHDPVLNERGTIAYGAAEGLEEYAYKEIELCDVLISIIGGRFGTQSADDWYSISQRELKRALDAERQVFIFIEQSVRAEYGTYLLNKESDLKYRFVDDKRVYQFIEEIDALPRNNAIASFETARDITTYLREQWAGLFQRFLQEERTRTGSHDLLRAERTAATLDQLLSIVSERFEGSDQAAQILQSNHPAFSRIEELFDLTYRVFFTTVDELRAWLIDVQGYSHTVSADARDKPDYIEWFRDLSGYGNFDLFLAYEGIFDDQGRLKPFKPNEWNPEWLQTRSSRTVLEQTDEGKGGDA